MSDYWKERQARQHEALFNKTLKETDRYLARLYKDTYKYVRVEIMDLWLDISTANGDVSANELYRYNRLYRLRENLNGILTGLGDKQLDGLDSTFEQVYKHTMYKAIDNFGIAKANKRQVKETVNALWEAKGKHWSTDIWCKDGLTIGHRVGTTMSKLQNTLERGLVDCAASGRSKDDLVKVIQKRFDVSFTEADRIVRTELTYVQNQAALEGYRKAGVKQYRYLATADDRTSDMCLDMDGQAVDINTAIVGVNMPPLHPNCRCTIIPIL